MWCSVRGGEKGTRNLSFIGHSRRLQGPRCQAGERNIILISYTIIQVCGMVQVYCFAHSIYVNMVWVLCMYRDYSIWSTWLIPDKQQRSALLSLLHCEVSQASRRSLQGHDGNPRTGHAT